MSQKNKTCPVFKRCGSCDYAGVPYEKQLEEKQKAIEELLSPFGKVLPIIGMENPLHYRNKVHHVFGYDKGHIISGSYEADSHILVNTDNCMLENTKCQEIICTVRELAASFKMRTYDEDTGRGLLRHILLRYGHVSGEIMVVLVMTSSVIPGKNNFIKALTKAHPEITTVVLNINDRDTSMVLGKVNKTLYGPGFIKDTLAGRVFRISPASFYQVNPVQTEKLYRTAIDFASLTGKETVVDAYCGIGTIGLAMSDRADRIIGVELNSDAVKDAIANAKENRIRNVRFYQGDAGDFLDQMVREKEKADVIMMDPPRSGSTEKFMRSAVSMQPSRIVYVSCGPDTLARDLTYFEKLGYKAEKIQPVDMFPFTRHVETVVLLSKVHTPRG